MLYKKAQKLKDLGFPQEGNGKKVLVENPSEGLSYWLYFPTEDEIIDYIIQIYGLQKRETKITNCQ